MSVSSVSDDSATAGTNPVTVTAMLGAAPGGEKVYARWTTNDFGVSALATAEVSGTTATLTIPGQPSGRTVTYYVLTSTMPTNVLTGAYDLCTLRANNAGGTNYAYLVGEAEPVFGNCWHFPTNEEPASVTMRNPVDPTPSADTYIYVGNYQGDADMTGGWVMYKESTAGTWSSNNLTYDSADGDNNYWVASVPSNAVALGETLRYYIQVDYTNEDADTTYLGTTDQANNVKYATATMRRRTLRGRQRGEPGQRLAHSANAEPVEAYMRNPRHPYASNDVVIYTGNQFAGDGNAADQSGGTLYYRLSGRGLEQRGAVVRFRGREQQVLEGKHPGGHVQQNAGGGVCAGRDLYRPGHDVSGRQRNRQPGLRRAAGGAGGAVHLHLRRRSGAGARFCLSRRQRGAGRRRLGPDLGEDRL